MKLTWSQKRLDCILNVYNILWQTKSKGCGANAVPYALSCSVPFVFLSSKCCSELKSCFQMNSRQYWSPRSQLSEHVYTARVPQSILFPVESTCRLFNSWGITCGHTFGNATCILIESCTAWPTVLILVWDQAWYLSTWSVQSKFFFFTLVFYSQNNFKAKENIRNYYVPNAFRR